MQHDGEGWRCLVAHLIWESARFGRAQADAALTGRINASSQGARTLHEHFRSRPAIARTVSTRSATAPPSPFTLPRGEPIGGSAGGVIADA